MQIRNSSLFVQQSAKFIPKQLLQNKHQRKFWNWIKPIKFTGNSDIRYSYS